MTKTPFDSVEGAHEYVGLLLDAVHEARLEVAEDLARALETADARSVEALRIVGWKLERLEAQLASSRKLLNDLRRLRHLLLGEPSPPKEPSSESADDLWPEG